MPSPCPSLISRVRALSCVDSEPEEFIALFGGKLVVRDGGLSKSGVDTRDHDGISLFQVETPPAI